MACQPNLKGLKNIAGGKTRVLLRAMPPVSRPTKPNRPEEAGEDDLCGCSQGTASHSTRVIFGTYIVRTPLGGVGLFYGAVHRRRRAPKTRALPPAIF